MKRPSFAEAWNRLSALKNALIFVLPFLLWDALFHSQPVSAQTSTDRLPTPCHWTHTPPVIDGLADDPGWNSAPLITNFRTPWLPTADASTPTINTQAKLLWDNEYLYVWAKLEDKDFQAYITERDAQTWLDDCFEVFLKPTEQHPGYYEFHVTPANTQMDLYIPERHRRAYAIYKSEHDFEFQSAVYLDGSIEPRTDVDTAWQVEFKIAWKDFWRTGGRPVQDEIWSYSLCRYDYDQSLNKPNLTTISPLSEPSFHRHEEFAKLRFLGPEYSELENLTEKSSDGKFVRIPMNTSRVAGSPTPPLPFTTRAVDLGFPIDHPIQLRIEPTSPSSKPGNATPIWIITQKNSYGPSAIYRLTPTENDSFHPNCIQPSVSDRVHYDLCFHPDFPTKPYLFVGLNEPVDGVKHSRILRLELNASSNNAVDNASTEVIDEKVIIEWPSDGHNGAALTFGIDGFLYITSGDGTTDSDSNLRGQDLSELTAKVLRIDVDQPSENKPYSIPLDNPFLERGNARPETWAYGLRNPWRITTDSQSGRIWIGQNGQDLWEQIYLLQRGANYGWSVMEGASVFYANRTPGPDPFIPPVMDHHHSQARSLTGGVVYRASKPENQTLLGDYIYGDYSTGKIWAISHDGNQPSKAREIADTPHSITAFEQLPDGRIWIADHLGKSIVELIPNDQLDNSEAFPKLLSQTGLFENVENHAFASGIIPYSVNSPLWSDGAIKRRAFAIPDRSADALNSKNGTDLPGEQAPSLSSKNDRRIEFQNQFGWTFPNETVLIKSFGLEHRDSNSSIPTTQWIETRLMVRQQNEWVGYSYRWNEEGTDAYLVDADGDDASFVVADPTAPDGKREQVWHYPSRAECMVCHSRAANYTLGLQTAQLNRVHDYGTFSANQLAVFEQLGLFRLNPQAFNPQPATTNPPDPKTPQDNAVEGPDTVKAFQLSQRPMPKETSLLPASPQRLPKLANPYDIHEPLDSRVQSYLHANCASCHAPAGGGNSAFDLQFPTPFEKMGLIDSDPKHQDFGIQSAKLIAPGLPQQSILLQRIAIRGNGQMPPIASNIVDQNAVDLIKSWIDAIPINP